MPIYSGISETIRAGDAITHLHVLLYGRRQHIAERSALGTQCRSWRQRGSTSSSSLREKEKSTMSRIEGIERGGLTKENKIVGEVPLARRADAIGVIRFRV